MTDQKSRIVTYDLIRSIAIAMVISIHTVETLFYWDLAKHNYAVHFINWLVQTILYILGRLGVPFFLMLTGALMFPRSYTTGTEIKQHLLHRFLPLYRVSVFWIFIFQIVENRPLALNQWINCLQYAVFLDIGVKPLLWYLPTILGIYLFLPIFSQIVQHFSSKVLWFYCGVVLLFCSIVPTLQIISTPFRLSILLRSLSSWGDHFLITLYPAYAIIGYLCFYRKSLRNVRLSWLALISSAALILLLVIQWRAYQPVGHGTVDLLWYQSFPIVALSVSLAEILTRLPLKRQSVSASILFQISSNSFAMYLIHFFIIELLLKYSKEWPFPWIVAYLAVLAAAFFGSWLLAWLLKKIPGHRLFIQ